MSTWPRAVRGLEMGRLLLPYECPASMLRPLGMWRVAVVCSAAGMGWDGMAAVTGRRRTELEGLGPRDPATAAVKDTRVAEWRAPKRVFCSE